MYGQSMSESDFKLFTEWLKGVSSETEGEDKAEDANSESSGMDPSPEKPGASADEVNEVKKEHVFGSVCKMCEDGSCH